MVLLANLLSFVQSQGYRLILISNLEYNMLMNFITVVGCALIIIIAYFYWRPLYRLSKFIKVWDNCKNPEDIADTYIGFKEIVDDYKNTMFDLDDKGSKTTSHAEDLYYRRNIARVIGVNLKAISSAPGLISGLGVLGTFIGLTISVKFFDSETSEAIMKSIQTLLGGMGTAFLTSVFGMSLSSLYIWQQKKIYNYLDIVSSKWCKILDDKNYISEIELLRKENERQQNAMMVKLMAIHESNIKQQETYTESLEIFRQQEEAHQSVLLDALVGYDEDGNKVKPGDMLLSLHEELEKQSQALESFTTDLSNELNSSLGKAMDTSIVPLIQDLERSHKIFNEKIDTLSANIKSPATDMVSTVVGELKTSMLQMTSEFSDCISTNTVNQMNELAAKLSQSSEVLNGIPQTMDMMTKSVTDNFNNVKEIISQMQSSVETQQFQLLNKSKSANDEIMDQMKVKFDEIMIVIGKAVSKLNEQQSGLIEGQDKSTREIARLLASFDESVNKMKQTNLETSRTLVNVQKVGESLDKSSGKINDMSTAMKEVADTLIVQQKESMQKYKEVQEANQDTVDNIADILKKTQELINDYTQQYDIIHAGLKDIFAEISMGLQNYSTTLNKNTRETLGIYSEALDKSTKGLQNVAQALNESAEELTQGVDYLRTKMR